MLSENEGCAVLQRVFEAHGYNIATDIDFNEGPVQFSCDGWDAKARVGFEYMTREAHDHEALGPDSLMQIAQWVQSGHLYLFIVDETDVVDASELSEAAEHFLAQVASRVAAKAQKSQP